MERLRCRRALGPETTNNKIKAFCPFARHNHTIVINLSSRFVPAPIIHRNGIMNGVRLSYNTCDCDFDSANCTVSALNLSGYGVYVR